MFYYGIILLNTLDNIIRFLLKINLIWCNKCNYNFKYIYIFENHFKYICINGICFIKKKNCNRCRVECDSRLIESKFLQIRAKPTETLRGGNGVRQFAPPCWIWQEWDKIKPCGTRVKTSSFGAAPPCCLPCYINFALKYFQVSISSFHYTYS